MCTWLALFTSLAWAQEVAPADAPPTATTEPDPSAAPPAPASEPPPTATEPEPALEAHPEDPAATEGAPEPPLPVDTVAPVGELRVTPPAPVDPTAPDRHGRGMSMAYGAVAGAHIGGSLGWLADQGEASGWAYGGVLGSGAGAATMMLLGQHRPWTADHTVLMGTGSAVGAFTGVQLARAVIAPGAEAEVRRIVAAGALGNVAGAGAAMAMSHAPPDRLLLARADLAAIIGWQAASGGLDVAGLAVDDHRQIRAPITLGAALGAGAATLALGPDAPHPDAELLTLSLLNGSWVGAWSPLLFGDTGTPAQHWGGLRLGLGAGYLGALALAPIVQPGPRSTTLQVLGMAAGNAIGAGIPLAAGSDPTTAPRYVVGPMLAGSVAGQVYGAALSRVYADAGPEDLALASTLGAWTAWQAVGWGSYGAHAVGDTRATGLALGVAGVGTAVGMGIAPLVPVTASESAMIAASGAWGSWYGGWAGHLLQLDADDRWVTTLVAGDAALLGTAFVLAGPADLGWRDLGLINGLGAVGGAGGAMLGVIAAPDPEVIAGASLVGSTIGLGAGALLSGRDRGADLALAGVPIDLTLPVGVSASARPWTDDQGGQGVWVQLDILETER